MSDRLPYWKQFPKDWNGDTDLASASLETQGGWMRILGALWDADNRGVSTMSIKRWTGILGKDEATTERVIEELKECNIAVIERDISGGVTIRSRRQTREEEKIEHGRELARDRKRKQRAKDRGDPVTPSHADTRARVQSPETIFQSPDTIGPDADSDSTSTPDKPRSDEFTQEFLSFKSQYPACAKKGRTNWKATFGCWRARLKDGIKAADMIQAATNYREDPEQTAEYIMGAQRFIGPNRDFETWLDGSASQPGPDPSVKAPKFFDYDWDQEFFEWMDANNASTTTWSRQEAKAEYVAAGLRLTGKPLHGIELDLALAKFGWKDEFGSDTRRVGGGA